MNDEMITLIQAEIDGDATPEQIARLDSASTTDPAVQSLRDEYRALATAVSRLPATEAPPGFTNAVMASLPPPRTVPTAAPVVHWIRSTLRSIIPSHRHQVAFAFALGVVVTLGLSVMITDLSQPGSDLVSGTMKAPSGSTVPFAADAGLLQTTYTDGVRQVVVNTAEARSLRITVIGTDGIQPELTVAASEDPLYVSREADSVVLVASRAVQVRFFVREPEPVRIVVESDSEQLLDWTSDPVDQ